MAVAAADGGTFEMIERDWDLCFCCLFSLFIQSTVAKWFSPFRLKSHGPEHEHCGFELTLYTLTAFSTEIPLRMPFIDIRNSFEFTRVVWR